MEHVREHFSHDKLAACLGMELLEVSEGKARVRMAVEERHMNSLRIVHGGALFSLADFAFAVASNSHGTVAVAISASMTFVKAIRGGTLFAEAEEISLNPKIATYLIQVTDDEGAPVATFHGMVYRKKETLQEARAELAD